MAGSPITMSREQLIAAANYHAEKCSEIAEFLALPGGYFLLFSTPQGVRVIDLNAVRTHYANHFQAMSYFDKQIS